MSAATVLVVASWYPSPDSLTSGRFVADQAAALGAAGRFAPVVASFDPLPLWGSGDLRRRQAMAVRALARAGLAASPLDAFVVAAGSAVPVAWLPVPGNARGLGPADRLARDRADVLEAAAAAVDAVAGAPVLVHAHTGFPDGAAAAAEAARRGVPLVITEHLSTLAAIAADPRRRSAYRDALTAAARVVAVSEGLADEVRALVPEAADRIVVVPNVVDVDAFAATPPVERRPAEILFVGNRKRSKGIDLLLDAFARARAARGDLRLRLVGAAPAALDAEWRRRAAALGIEDAVAFDPETDRAGVAAAMSRAGLFVHPSPRETFGVVAAEALAAGLPVVAVDSGGVAEVLGPDPAANGALVPPGDAGRLAAAILDVLARRDAFPPAVLREHAAARFGPAAVAGRLAEVYDDALATAPAGPDATGSSATERPSATRRIHPGAFEGVVVGLDRARVARLLAAVPPPGRARLRVVTADGPEPALPAGIGTLRTVPGAAARHAALRAAGDAAAGAAGRRRRALLARPLVVAREARQRLPGVERGLLAAASAAVLEVAAAGGHVAVLDGFDALAAEAAVGRGLVTPLAGAGRRLAGEAR